MANVSVKDWAAQRGYKDKDINYDPKTKKISIAGVSYGEPTVKDGKSYMSEYDLDKVYGQQKLNQSEKSNTDVRTQYMNTVNQGYKPGTFQYDKNKDSAYAAAMSSSKAALDRNLLENKWAMESQGRAGGGYAMDRANKLIADENRRMQIEVVPALEDRALNRFNTAEAQKRQSWQDKVTALQAQYGITNDDVNRWTNRVNNSQTLGQNQTNWQATYDQTKEENRLNREATAEQSELSRQLQMDQLKEQKRQFDLTMAFNKSQNAGSGGSSSGGSQSGGGGSSRSGGGESDAPFKTDNVEDINKMISGNKTFFTKNIVTGDVRLKDEARGQISTIIKESMLTGPQKKQLFSQYGLTSEIESMNKDKNFQLAMSNPQLFLDNLFKQYKSGQISQNQFYRRMTYYGVLPLWNEY